MTDASKPTTQGKSSTMWFKVGLGVLTLLSLLFLFSRLSSVGIWEPWEAYDILVAQEYRSRGPSSPEQYTGHNWAVPTFNGKPIGYSLLKVWLLNLTLPQKMEDITTLIGTLEWRSRLPIAMSVFALVFGVFAWLKQHFTAKAATLSAIALVCLPVVFIGVHSLTMPLLMMVTTSAALICLAQILHGKKTWLWTIGFGVSLAATSIDSRAFGLVMVLGTVAAWALTQMAFGQTDEEQSDLTPALWQRILAVVVLLLPVIRLAAAWSIGIAHVKKPHVLQQLYLMTPLCLILASLIWARRTKVGQVMLGIKGVVVLAITAVVLAPVLVAYADVNPTLLKNGEVFGKMPVLSFLLEHHLFQKSFAAKHVHFDLWLRQIGFAAFPWIALIPHGLGYMMRASRRVGVNTSTINTPQMDIQRMLVIWATLGFAITAAASAYGHFFYPAYVPLAIGVGVMLADDDFWQGLRKQPLLLYAMGFVSVAIIMMLGKDIERYPNRFLELYVAFEQDLKLPKDFSYGRIHKLFKYAIALTLMTTFFGWISWAFLTLRDLPGGWGKLKAFLKQNEDEQDTSPMEARLEQREALYEEDSLAGKLARLIETPPQMALVITGVMVLSCLTMLFVYVPRGSDHLSQRHLFESYLKSAKNKEPLYRYQSPNTKNTVYLRDVKSLGSSRELFDKFDSDQRLFVIIPRERLAAVNSELRQRFKRNAKVINARSNRLVLLSNKLSEGQKDQNFVAQAIVEGDPFKEIQYKTLVDNDSGQKIHPTFDGQLQVLGYSFQIAKPAKGLPVFGWGDDVILTTYFKVLKPVPTKQKIFLHVDTRGNRIAGDHYPVNDEFSTNYWLPGDVVKDTYQFKISPYTTQGTYMINMGFYLGSKRMKVAPKKAHNRDNRLKLGQFIVKP